MPVAQEAGADAPQVGRPGPAGAAAHVLDHRGRHVDGDNPAAVRGGGHGEAAGARGQVDHGGPAGQHVVPAQDVQVRLDVGVALLAVVTRDEVLVQVLRAGMGEFVELPGVGHGEDPLATRAQ